MAAGCAVRVVRLGLPAGVLFAIAFWVESNPRPPFWGLLGLSVALFAVGGVFFGVLVWWIERLTAAPAELPAVAELPSQASERGPPLRVLFEWIGWESDEPSREVIDLADGGRFTFLFMAFGVGHYIEARVVGESPEAVEAFRRLVWLGGYTQAGGPPSKARLYRPGDEAYPPPEPFVFVCAAPDSELVHGASVATEADGVSSNSTP